MRRLGVSSIEPLRAMRALEALLDRPAAQMGYVRTTRPAAFGRPISEPAAHNAVDVQGNLGLALKSVVGEVLNIAPSELTDSVPLEEYGMDSILLTRVAQRLRTRFPDLPGATLFEHPTLDSLARHLLETYPAEATQTMTSTTRATEGSRSSARRRTRRGASRFDREVRMLERFKRGELSMDDVERLLDEERIA
jgi:aryl carrier-like protein